MPYAYCAEMYCDDCGRRIIADLKRDDVEDTGDTEDYPQWGSSEESVDCPQHCANQGDCVDPVELTPGLKVGKLLDNPLTEEGVRYVREVIEDGEGLCVELWAEAFADQLRSDDDDED